MKNNNTWVIASGNRGKIAEFQRIFSESEIHIIPQSELEVVEAEETGLSFIENAILKARNASAQTRLPALADDSGLEVASLLGRPGIFSARYSRPEVGDACSDQTNNKKLLKELRDKENRDARFICALAFVRHADDPTPVVATGSWPGHILTAPRGVDGFGYDPLFFCHQEQCTAAELAPDVKNRVSHRGKAMVRLVDCMKEENII